MPLTGAERQRRYRQKLSQENPEKLLQQKRENLERTKNKYKKVSELTEKQQNLQREKWRREKQKCKDEPIVNKTPEDKKKIATQRVLYFRKLKRENLNLKSTVAKLVKKSKTQNRQINRYKKKIEQLKRTIIILKSNEQEEQIGHTEEFEGAADGVGGATKRSLERYVAYGHDISDAKAAYNVLVKDNTSKVKYFIVPDEDVEKSIKMLDAISKNLIVVPETMSIHQVVSTPNTQIIKFRKLSCFCGEDFGFCDCFDLTEHNLNQKRKMIKAEAKTIKKRRLNSSKKHLLADDSDTDTDIDITFAESDDSKYDIELIDSDDIEDNEKSIMLVEDKTVDNKCRGDGAIDITQDSDCMEKKSNNNAD